MGMGRLMIPILCYHKVGLARDEGRWLCVSPDRLGQHIRFLQRRYRIVAASDWRQKGVAALTFDDAYVSALTTGVEVMLRHHVPATFFAVSDGIGKESFWDAPRTAPLASIELLREVQAQGFEIGLHTKSHRSFNELSEGEAIDEVRACREELSAHGIGSDILAYPYGHVGHGFVRALESISIRFAFQLGNRPAAVSDHHMSIPRIVMSYGDALPMLVYKIYVRPKIDPKIRKAVSIAKYMQQ